MRSSGIYTTSAWLIDGAQLPDESDSNEDTGTDERAEDGTVDEVEQQEHRDRWK